MWVWHLGKFNSVEQNTYKIPGRKRKWGNRAGRRGRENKTRRKRVQCKARVYSPIFCASLVSRLLFFLRKDNPNYSQLTRHLLLGRKKWLTNFPPFSLLTTQYECGHPGRFTPACVHAHSGHTPTQTHSDTSPPWLPFLLFMPWWDKSSDLVWFSAKVTKNTIKYTCSHLGRHISYFNCSFFDL